VKIRKLFLFRSLFLKIFVCFWLAAAAIIGALTLMNWLSYNQSLPERLRGSVGEGLSLYAEAAVRTYDHEGSKAFDEFIGRSLRESGTEIYLFDGNGAPLAGKGDEVVNGLAHELQQQPQQDRLYHLVLGKLTWGKPVTAASGKQYIFVIHYHAPSLGPPVNISSGRIVVSILIAGIVCYLLALYLSSPLKKLQRTVHDFAEGNLDARVTPALGNRRDDLADLGREFDLMAERIAALISAQQRLLADISHELRSPLARLSVALELARKSTNGSAVSALDRIEKEAERVNLLVGQLLALTRLESGAERVPPEIVVLEELVQQVIDDANFEAKPLHKEVRAIALEHCRVLGSAELLRSAVENVIRNAVRYTKPGSAVEVSLQWKLDTAVFTVRDHGPGVPETELEHIFEPFYRVSEARERASGGAGLGLSIADRTVKLHGGSIAATNASPGLQVIIQLPLAPSLSSSQGLAPSAFAPASSASA
jgi:two-component system, OmpR family, sensor histidine kinase CpxA